MAETNQQPLVERLRLWGSRGKEIGFPIADEAADTITRLTAERDALRGAGDELADKANLLTFASQDEPLNEVAKAAIAGWDIARATLKDSVGDEG